MKYFIDTEFMEDGRTIDLLSLAIVREDGLSLYAVNRDADRSLANDWVKENVVPFLDSPPPHTHSANGTRKEIADAVRTFIALDGGKPQFWGYYADYDWVAFCQLFGCMVDLPKGWPMYCRDIKQWCDHLGNPTLPANSEREHNALNDARWNMAAYRFLNTFIDCPKEISGLSA